MKKFSVKVYRGVPIMDNPHSSCGFKVIEEKEIWRAVDMCESTVLGYSLAKGVLRVFTIDEIKWEE